MASQSRVFALALLLVALPGCGLVLDYGPPDPVARDASGAFDASGQDAGRRDAGRTDSGVLRCRTDVDCDDGMPCNGVELCADRACVAGEPVVCPDENVCDGIDACDPVTGQCRASTAMACPADTNVCNGEEFCDPILGCTSTAPPSCDDGIACTSDSCSVDSGCTHTPDSTVCTAGPGGVCTSLGCTYPTCAMGITCVPNNPCDVATCMGTTCHHTPMPCAGGQQCCGGACVAMGCDDGVACTADRCEPSVGCVNVPRTGSCDDGNACTSSDRCAGTACTGSPRVCGTTAPCQMGVCDPSSGSCDTVLLEGNLCTDGDPCTVGDVCHSGVCMAGMGMPVCDDFEPCTTDGCTPAAGCVNAPVPDDTVCNNGGLSGTCMLGRCSSGGGCPAGLFDCDGDGVCECTMPCAMLPRDAGGISTCLAPLECTSAASCAVGQDCCTLPGAPSFGRCFDPLCLSCC